MKKLVFSILFAMLAVVGWAQDKPASAVLTGKVVDAKSQKPMQSAVATIENTSFMGLADAEGVFRIEGVTGGKQMLRISSAGYSDKLLPIDLKEGQTLDLGIVVLEEDQTSEQQLALITLTENDLGDDNSGSESTSGLLQATRDTYQQAAAFNWGQARFRVRGLDNEYGTTMINGIVMNKIYDGRPQWSNWGGLNDATRNQEFTTGSAPSDYIFGGVLGTQEINTRASIYRPGTRLSAAGANTNYTWRTMATHASGMSPDGWAYVISAGYRGAQEGYFEGTDYDALSLFASVEKRLSDSHSLNVTAIYAQNSRGKNSPNTQEVTDLAGVKYNSYWGWQDGKKRNSRDKDVEEPIFILSHFWKINDRNRLNTNVSYQTGKIGNSRFDQQNANNPDPSYYRNLPSYYLNYGTFDDQFNFTHLPDLNGAAAAKDFFLANRQIDWNAIYEANQNTVNGNSSIVLYEDRTDDTQWSANSIFSSTLSDNIDLNAGVNFRRLKSHNFQNLLDLLGGQYFLDIDTFNTSISDDATQSDLNNPNRQVRVGDTYGYNYNLFATTIDAFTQFRFRYRKVDFYLAQSFSRNDYKREGLYRNGLYANNSFGDSKNAVFETFGFKGGATIKITGRQFIDLNAVYMTKAPTMRSTFANARLNNNITPDLAPERVTGGDISYVIRNPKFKARLTGFYSKMQNTTELSFFYAESIGDETNAEADQDAFISEILTGADKQNIGAELGLEYQITSTLKITGAANYGQYIYTNNPRLRVNDDALATEDNQQPIIDFGKAYLKNYRVAGTPQQAYSLGLEYRDPKFWWVGANINWLDDNYLDVSNILRTDNFTLDSQEGVSFPGADDANVRAALKQEKFDGFSLLNLTGGKSWKVGGTTFGFFATINNVLDREYKTGGFEQSRKATYPDFVQDNSSVAAGLNGGARGFGPKYFYGYGRTFFVNFYVNL